MKKVIKTIFIFVILLYLPNFLLSKISTYSDPNLPRNILLSLENLQETEQQIFQYFEELKEKSPTSEYSNSEYSEKYEQLKSDKQGNFLVYYNLILNESLNPDFQFIFITPSIRKIYQKHLNFLEKLESLVIDFNYNLKEYPEVKIILDSNLKINNPIEYYKNLLSINFVDILINFLKEKGIINNTSDIFYINKIKSKEELIGFLENKERNFYTKNPKSLDFKFSTLVYNFSREIIKVFRKLIEEEIKLNETKIDNQEFIPNTERELYFEDGFNFQ